MARFLATCDLPTPYLVVDIDLVAERYHELAAALPPARIHYAVKANPAPEILRRLVELGSAFDVASPREIELCLEAGATPADLSFGSTIKKRDDVARARDLGVRRFAVDSDEELDKVLDLVEAPSVSVRLFHDCEGSDWPLSRKFGCSPAHALALARRAARAGASTGLTFHVGSQQHSPEAWDGAIAVCAQLFAAARDEGWSMDHLNLGGGFPSRYRDEMLGIDRYGLAIMRSLRQHFGDDLPELIAEPGRYLVGDAGVIASEVVLVSERPGLDARRWVYLDVGIFSGLIECLEEAIRYRLVTERDDDAHGPVVLAGPTCDSADILYEKSGVTLPVTLREGDRVLFLSAGAYTASYSSVGFNGFDPLRQIVI